MKNPEGFCVANTGEVNARILQAALDNNSLVEIDIPGIYDIGDTIYLNSNNTLIFGDGVQIRRVKCNGFDGNAFINRGAFTGIADTNITIKGLNLIVNGVESTVASEECTKTVLGLRAHIAFFYIENLVLENITVTGLLHKDYGIQICNFKNVTVDTILVEGNKDGIHFGPGDGFVLRNGTFRTGDDPIALNADDYSVSNPTLGEIKNGIIENCRDELWNEKSDGFFVRILSGSWGDWYSGMKVQHSDSVIYNDKLYRVVMTPSYDEFISINPPDFDSGFKTIDGIRWAKTGYDKVYCSKVSNITFRNLYCERPRGAAVAFSVEQNDYRRGYYEGSDFPINGDFYFENIQVKADIRHPVIVLTPVKSISIANSDFNNGALLITADNNTGLKSPPLRLHIDGNSFEKKDIIIKDREVLFE